MNKNVLIVLIGGFVVAILVAVLVQASLGGKKVDDSGEKIQVLVAAKDLPLGSNLTTGDLKWQTWPGQAFNGAIIRQKDQRPEEALAGRLTTRVSQGQPVLNSYTFKEGRGNIVAASMSKGKRAVAIPVKANTMAGGFVSPGDYVDVILTYRLRGAGNTAETKMLIHEVASETILKNVRVLAVDQEATRDADAAKVAKTVTLEVDSVGAEKVALAAEMGDMILSLRGLGDDDNENTSTYTTDVDASLILQNMALIENGGAGGAVKIYNGSDLVEQRPRGAVTAPQGGVQKNNNLGEGSSESSTNSTEEGVTE